MNAFRFLCLFEVSRHARLSQILAYRRRNGIDASQFMAPASVHRDFDVFEPHFTILSAVNLQRELALASARIVLQFRALDAIDVNDDVAPVCAHSHFVPLAWLEP